MISIIYFEKNKINTTYESKTLNIKNKIAGFDLDHTLIRPKSKCKFPKNIDDWKFYYHSFPNKLREISDEYTIVIFTNQSRIGNSKLSISEFNQKINNIQKKLNINMIVLVATINDYYRKPHIGMWKYLETLINIDYKNSFYCGDAAGRIHTKKKTDFSSSDKYFAQNIGIQFYTPETYFLKKKDTYKYKKYPINLDELLSNKYNYLDNYNIDLQEIILMVGLPASGKSTFANTKFNNYSILSLDILKTKPKLVKLLLQEIEENNSIIIDNTNITIEIRKEYIEIAKQKNIQIRCVHMNIPLLLCKHLNHYRLELYQNKNKLIPTIAYNILNKRYQKPNINEGFDEIIEINQIDFSKLNKIYFLKNYI